MLSSGTENGIAIFIRTAVIICERVFETGPVDSCSSVTTGVGGEVLPLKFDRHSSCTAHPAVCDDPQPHMAGGGARACGGLVKDSISVAVVKSPCQLSFFSDVLVLRVPIFL